MNHLVNHQMLEGFIDKVKNVFPNAAEAVVIADRHGLPIASRIEQPGWDENLLACSAISDRKLLDLNDYQKVVRPLSNETQLMVVLKKNTANLHRFKIFNQVLEAENPM